MLHTVKPKESKFDDFVSSCIWPGYKLKLQAIVTTNSLVLAMIFFKSHSRRSERVKLAIKNIKNTIKFINP